MTGVTDGSRLGRHAPRLPPAADGPPTMDDMPKHGLSPVPNAGDCPTGRLRQLTLVAAARVDALRPTSPQQVEDVVRVTVDSEVNTATFRAIVAEVSPT